MRRKSRELICWSHLIKEDEPIAVEDHGVWQRGLVTKVDQKKWVARIAFRDEERLIWRPFRNIYHLEDRFRMLPWQALICGLAYTGPAKPAKMWPAKTRALSRILAERQTEWINIIHPLGAGVALIKLELRARESGLRTINLRDALVRLGHARVEEKVTVDTFPAV
ncbi:hypothetical protein P5V15_007131 [Pogonomyrmex californicus]